jgi:hypothetical protein
MGVLTLDIFGVELRRLFAMAAGGFLSCCLGCGKRVGCGVAAEALCIVPGSE